MPRGERRDALDLDGSTPRSRRWPLRAGLSLSLVGLLALNVGVAHEGRAVATTSPRLTTTTGAVTTTSGPAPTTSGPTTSLASVAPHVRGPITSPAVLDPPRRGCGFAMAGAASTPTTTSPTSATSTSDAGSSTSTSLATTTTAARPGPAPLGHCVVLEIGDSLGNDLGWGLARELRAPGLTLVQLDKSSSGLANGWFFDWPSHLRAALARYRPNLVIVCLGGNDEQAMKIAGRTTAFATPAWVRAYRGFVHQIVDTATRAGTYVLWVGMPIMGPAGYRQGMAVLNAAYAAVAGTTPGSAFLPTWGLFADARGRFATVGRVGGVATVLRSPDGIHFSYVGENVFATYVAREWARIFQVRLTPLAPAVITP